MTETEWKFEISRVEWNKWMDTLESEIYTEILSAPLRKSGPILDPNRYYRVVGGSGAASELIV